MIGKVFLENGRVLQADLVIGADGVHVCGTIDAHVLR